ncbi:MAG: ribosomal protein S18-alanine N-acetyltransferase [Clostridia bacterium]|nr:ribosomal protein S18-alanine N-acetyltransferase [Clostridia bacterium]
MQDITVRAMEIGDTKALAELDIKCFAVPWSEQAFRDEAENDLASYLVAVKDGELVGYIGYWRVVDEGHITNIAVSPKYRRQKIASNLLENIIKAAYNEGLVLLTLEVRKSNTAARSLYEGYGFLPLGERKGYYHSPTEDAVIMTLMLGDN